MKSMIEHLAQYAAYHRDPRNIRTHLVGIPIIFMAVGILLSRPVVEVAGVPLTLAWAVSALAALFYLRLDLRYGVVMSALTALSAWVGGLVAALDTTLWLEIGLGLFVGGWIVQFVGHFYEGRKPAFFDDLLGLLVGPLFVTAEIANALGLRLEVRDAVEAIAGRPAHRRGRAAPISG